MTPDVAVLAQAAAKHGVPPAILFALGSQVSGYSDTVLDGGVQANETIGVFGLKPEQARLYGYQPADLKGNLELQADLAARLLAQDFAANGSWESALSQYVSGDPNAYQSPTSPLGGRVNAVLGIAAARSTYGLNQMGDAVDMHSFLPGATSFAQSINRMASLGGVVSQSHASSFSQRVQQLSAGQSHQAGVSTEAAMAEVLRQAQLPVTQANVALLSTMAQGEGMDPHSYNWLATTQGDGVGTVPGTPGVKVFGSYQDGIQNTAATLLNGNYTPLVNLMRSGADLHTMASSPGVQSALRTWQGGSSEDVNNLLRQPNVSGQPWAAPASGGSGGNTVTAGLQAAAKNNAQDYSAGQCIAEGTLVETERGGVPIELVTSRDRVLTRQGFRRVLWSGMTRRNAEVLRIQAGDRHLVCTPDHRIWSQQSRPSAFVVAPLGGLIANQASDMSVTGAEGLAVGVSFAARRLGFASALHDFPVGGAYFGNTGAATVPHPGAQEVGHADHLVAVDLPSPVDLPIRLSGDDAEDAAHSHDDGEAAHDVFVGHPQIGLESYAALGLVAVPTAFTFEKTRRPSNVHGPSHTVDCTSRWTDAGHIRPGDSVWCFDRKALVPVVVTGVEHASLVNTYDLTVEEVPEFIASGILVHNCTYYAARSLGFIPGHLGDAMDWAHNAAAMGMSVDHRPAVGTAVVYGPGGAYSPDFGHVAVVTKVNADGSFQVSEMNVDGQYVADTRQSSMADVIGFIHPPPGTDMATAAPGLKQTVAAIATPAQPGAAPTPQRPQPRRMPQQDRGAPEPTPQQISRFAEHAQAAGLGPADVERLMPQVAPLRRMLLEQGTSLDDLAPHRGKAPEEILAAIRGTPHPLAPNVMAGDLVDRFHQATLHALPQLRRMPHITEAASFAASGFKDSEIAAYYQRMAEAHQATSAEPLAQSPHAALTETDRAQPSGDAEVIQLRQQERAR